jgi:hypothetical protein
MIPFASSRKTPASIREPACKVRAVLTERPLSLSTRGHTLLRDGFRGQSSISGNRFVSRERRGWAATRRAPGSCA